MQPRTKVQKEIVALYEKLPPLTEKQEAWAKTNATAHIGFVNKGFVWCSECGRIVPCQAEEGQKIVCPCCGAKLKICESLKKKNESREYVTYITTKGRFQVLRHFILVQKSRMGVTPEIFFTEVVQEWIEENGYIHYVARRRNCCNFYVDNFIFDTELELRDADGYSVYAYQVFANYIYPYMRVLPILKRNGFKKSFHGITPSNFFMALLGRCPHAEWLLKSKQYELFRDYVSYGTFPYKDSVKICIRNNYRVKNVDLWYDYLKSLEYFGKDIHNAHYVCPKNLKEAHDYWMNRKNRELKRIEEERKKAEAARWEKLYAEQKGKFIGITFSGSGINVSVLPSVAAFVEEADAMHHCVYTNEYYKKEESLILSAKDDNGERLETIEVDLGQFKVKQCYGACNKFTPQHEQILELVNKNMNLIRQAV